MYKKKIIEYKFINEKEAQINLFIRYNNCKYYHLNKFGELTENEVEKGRDLKEKGRDFKVFSFWGKEYKSKLKNKDYYNFVFFVVFELENIKYKI